MQRQSIHSTLAYNPNDVDSETINDEDLDLEKDERTKFFFVETSKRDHLRKHSTHRMYN